MLKTMKHDFDIDYKEYDMAERHEKDKIIECIYCTKGNAHKPSQKTLQFPIQLTL